MSNHDPRCVALHNPFTSDCVPRADDRVRPVDMIDNAGGPMTPPPSVSPAPSNVGPERTGSDGPVCPTCGQPIAP